MPDFPKLPDKIQPGHVGNVVVRDKDIEGLIHDRPQSGSSIVTADDIMPSIGEESMEQLLLDRAILGVEDSEFLWGGGVSHGIKVQIPE